MVVGLYRNRLHRNGNSRWLILLFTVLMVIFTVVPVMGQSDLVEESGRLLQDNYVDNVPSAVLQADTVYEMLKLLGDPYANYFTKEEFKKEMEMLNGSFTGVGVVFAPGKEGATIIQLLSGAPAEQAGLKVDDLVVEAGGHSLVGLSHDQVSDIIRGPAGSTVILKIKRTGQVLEFKLTRKEINLPTVVGGMLNDNTGLLELSEFGARSTEEMEAAIKNLKAKKADRWILDMRDNPGGFLDTAMGIAGFFIGNGDTVIVKERSGQETYQGEINEEYIDGPMIVLVNENSASAAEIITAALKDQKRALIIGHKTYGKGTVQQVFELSNGDSLKFTIARFYSPLDNPINGIGVEPDISVSDDNVLKAAELLLYSPPDSYQGSLIRIDTDNFAIAIDPVKARSAEYWSGWTEIIKGCAKYQFYVGKENESWTGLSQTDIEAMRSLYYPEYQYQGEMNCKAGQKQLKLDFLKDVKPSYLNDSNLQLIKALTGERIPLQFTVDADKAVLLNPQKAMEPGEYWLAVDNTYLQFSDDHKLDKGLIEKIKVIQ